ncbi:aromatic ring-hydroxylating dioxygenase subunit alpha [Alteraurantiacibacter aestuarii]
MFEDFANLWTIVGIAADLKPRKLHPIVVGGERIVMFRGADNQPAALIDRCPHRGVALSLGTLCDGIVECPFHGWRFDGSGANRGVPWNPDAKLDQLHAQPVPIREVGGLIWIYTGFAPESEPVPSETLSLPGIVLSAQAFPWAAHWTRAMENMLDTPHLPFVHKATIGRGMRTLRHQRMDLTWSVEEYGARIGNHVEGKESKGRLDYRYPNAMELFIDPPGRIFRMLAICLPQQSGHTSLIIVTMRNFARWSLLDPLFRFSTRKIAGEDQQILESSSPAEIPPASKEKSVRTDMPTLAFRKIYFDQIKGSSATP